MVEEKARSLLPRHHFASLSYYIAEYSAKAMTIDAFVAVLLEMLDTYEKVNDISVFCLSFVSLLLPHFFLTQRCVQILKSSRQISMTVRAPPTLNSTAPLHGFGPPSRDPMYASMAPLLPQTAAGQASGGSGGGLPFRQTCSWMDRHGRPASPPMEYGGRRNERRDR